DFGLVMVAFPPIALNICRDYTADFDGVCWSSEASLYSGGGRRRRPKPPAGALQPRSGKPRIRTEQLRTSLLIRFPGPGSVRTGAFKQNPRSTIQISWMEGRLRPLYADGPVQRRGLRVRR